MAVEAEAMKEEVAAMAIEASDVVSSESDASGGMDDDVPSSIGKTGTFELDPDQVLVPPEGADLHRRWSELETTQAALEDERDALRTEVAQLRSQLAEQAATVPTKSAVPVPDSAVVQEMQRRLDEARKRDEARLADLVNDRRRIDELSAEVQRQISEASSLSTEKLELINGKTEAEQKFVPLSEENIRLRREKEDAERAMEALRRDFSGRDEELAKLYDERAVLKQSFAVDIEQARVEVAKFKQEAQDAVAAREAARQQATTAEQRLSERTEAFDRERFALQRKIDLRGKQLEEAEEQLHSGESELTQARRERDDAEKAREAVEHTLEGLTTNLNAMAEKNRKLEDARKEAEGQRQDAPTPKSKPRFVRADVDVPIQEFVNAFELVQNLTAAREELIKERQQRETVQDALHQLDVAARTRLLDQRDELLRLRRVSEKLGKENERLLAQQQACEGTKKEAEHRAQKAQQSAEILEKHARDMASELAMVIHGRRLQKLGDRATSFGAALGQEELSEAERRAFREVQDLVEQNESLRKANTRLLDGCETAAQKELRATLKEQEKRAAEWHCRLDERAQEVAALHKTVERLTRERDEAQLVASLQPPIFTDQSAQHRAGPAEGSAEASPPQHSEPAPEPLQPAKSQQEVLHDQLMVSREEFIKVTEMLHSELREVRAAEVGTRNRLAEEQAKLHVEKRRRGDAEANLERTTSKLGDCGQEVQELKRKAERLDEDLRREELTAQDLEARNRQAYRDKEQLQAQLRVERSRVLFLEQSNEALLKDRAAHGEVMLDLQKHLADECGKYKGKQKELEEAYKREEILLKKQLEVSERRHHDLSSTVEELNLERKELKKEAAEAKGRSAELEEAVVRLEAQLAERNRDLDDLRAAGTTRPRRGADLASEVDSQTLRDRKCAEHAQLEQRLRHVEQSARKHEKQTEVWRSLLASKESELETSRKEIEDLRSKAAAALETAVLRLAEIEQERERAERLEARIRELDTQVKDSRADLTRRDEEFATAVEAARLEGHTKGREEEREAGQAEAAVREEASAQGAAEDWRQRHRQAVDAHHEDIKLLEEASQKHAALEEEIARIRKQSDEFKGDAARLQECLKEVEDARRRAESAERIAEALSVEVQSCKEQILAASTGTCDNPGGHAAAAAKIVRARGILELQNQELELDKGRLEDEKSALRVENEELKQCLELKEAEVARLRSDTRVELSSSGTRGRIGELEDENRRLSCEVESLRGRLEAEPLERGTRELRKREQELEKREKELQLSQGARQTERIQLEKKLQLLHTRSERLEKEHKDDVSKLREEATKAEANRAAAATQLANVQQELRQRTLEATRNNEAKAREDDLQKKLQAAATAIEDFKKENSRLEALKSLRDKRIAELEEELRKGGEEQERLRVGAAEAAAGAPAAAANLKRKDEELADAKQKAEASLKRKDEELVQARRKLDSVLGLAIDYRSVVDTLVAEQHEKSGETASVAPGASGAGPEASKASAGGGSAATSAVASPGKRKEAPGVSGGSVSVAVMASPMAGRAQKAARTAGAAGAGAGAGGATTAGSSSSGGTAGAVGSAAKRAPTAATRAMAGAGLGFNSPGTGGMAAPPTSAVVHGACAGTTATSVAVGRSSTAAAGGATAAPMVVDLEENEPAGTPASTGSAGGSGTFPQ